MEIDMRVNGCNALSMVKVLIFLQMGILILVNINLASLMEMDNTNGKMEVYILVNLRMA
jgi:hypothetical protein